MGRMLSADEFSVDRCGNLIKVGDWVFTGKSGWGVVQKILPVTDRVDPYNRRIFVDNYMGKLPPVRISGYCLQKYMEDRVILS